MKKVYVIKGKNEEELVKNINCFDKEIFATQPIQKNDNSFIAFVYCDEDNRLDNEKGEELATEKQIYFLKKKGVEIKEGLTKQEAFNLIKEIKGKQPQENY